MKRTIVGCALSVLAVTAIAARPGDGQELLQQKLAAAKQNAAANQRALRSYTWLEKTELFLKGELKVTKVDSCRYGPDGQIQKTPVVQPPPAEKARGLKGKAIEKKKAEMKEELQATAALIHRYIPPAPDMMQVVINAGTASMAQAGPDAVSLIFPGYVKAGDSLTLTFEKAVTSLREIEVRTYLERPDEPANLKVTMTSLPDGTSHPGTIVLRMPASNLEMRVTRSNYQKLAT